MSNKQNDIICDQITEMVQEMAIKKHLSDRKKLQAEKLAYLLVMAGYSLNEIKGRL